MNMGEILTWPWQQLLRHSSNRKGRLTRIMKLPNLLRYNLPSPVNHSDTSAFNSSRRVMWESWLVGIREKTGSTYCRRNHVLFRLDLHFTLRALNYLIQQRTWISSTTQPTNQPPVKHPTRPHLIRLHWPALHVQVPDLDGQIISGHHVAAAVAELNVRDGRDDFWEERAVAGVFWLLEHCPHTHTHTQSLLMKNI